MGRLFIFVFVTALLAVVLAKRPPPEPEPAPGLVAETRNPGPRLVPRSTGAAEVSQPPPTPEELAPEAPGRDGASSTLRDELVERLIDSGAMNTSVNELDRAFEELTPDASADALVAATLHNEFASNEAVAAYFLTRMECREAMCRGEVRAMDGRRFDNDAIAALAVSLGELQPNDPYTVYVSGDDPTSARVFLHARD